jgi:Leucine-rich repeat (LRR) protein
VRLARSQFATNFKCSESKQSDEYVADVVIYVNEVSEHGNKRAWASVDLSTVGLGFLSDEDWASGNGASYRHITSLNLSQNVIKTISFGLLLRYPSVQDLDLSRNCLTSLDAKHKILFKNLQSLNVSRNLLTSVHPFAFSNLTLEVVDLSHNHLLRFLAADFEILTLHINDNRLTQLDIDSGHHKELRLLDASNNNITLLQLNIDLNNLILANNQLTMDEHFSIRNVYGTLDMSANHISEFDWKFTSCVTNLDIAYNRIALFHVDCPAKRLQRLKRLNLDGNFLCNLNGALDVTRCFPNLKFITAMYNRLSKAQKVEIKSALRKMKVKSQMFDYDGQPVAACDDDDCIAFDIFFKKLSA